MALLYCWSRDDGGIMDSVEILSWGVEVVVEVVEVEIDGVG